MRPTPAQGSTFRCGPNRCVTLHRTATDLSDQRQSMEAPGRLPHDREVEKWEYGELHTLVLSPQLFRAVPPEERRPMVAIILGNERNSLFDFDRDILDIFNQYGAQGWEIDRSPRNCDVPAWVQSAAEARPSRTGAPWLFMDNVYYPMRRRFLMVDPS